MRKNVCLLFVLANPMKAEHSSFLCRKVNKNALLLIETRMNMNLF